jgi:hypothetical protein
MRMPDFISPVCRCPGLKIKTWGTRICLILLVLLARTAFAETGFAQAADSDVTEPLDRVIAVVNNQVILASDLAYEVRFFWLLPINNKRDSSPPKALERLTTRALIEQQILLEDPHGMDVAPADLEASLAELRQSLPDCKRQDCISPAGWAKYLATIGLTPKLVSAYWANRMAVLRFIEQRFRTGIRIPPEEIQKYYAETLTPQYVKPEDVPPLARVSERIQEILLQQQVSALFDDWLKSLKDQGQVEILDPALVVAEQPAPAGATEKKGGGN